MPPKNSEQRDLFRGTLEMMILRSVMRAPMHGYALVQHIKQRSKDFLQVEEGSLYPALQRLLREGLLKAEWENSASNRRVRTYRITPAGKKHLEREISSFEKMIEAITMVLSPAKS
jgi:PadR family transcriptional regulator PadR